MTSENEYKVSSDVSTAGTEHVKMPNTTVTDDKELKKTNRQSYKCYLAGKIICDHFKEPCKRVCQYVTILCCYIQSIFPKTGVGKEGGYLIFGPMWYLGANYFITSEV